MPVNNPYDMIQQLMEQNASLVAVNADLVSTVNELNKTIAELNQTISELKEQINKNSNNSSKPPSSDGLKKPPVNKNRSLRGRSGKKQGAQIGHDGTYLSILTDPDFTENHMHHDCENCPMHDQCLDKACIAETRRTIDAEMTVNITAYNLIVVKDCPMHHVEKRGSFPDDIKATVQYGKNLQAIVVALNTVGAVSISRIHEILSSMFEIPISTGTIKNMVSRCAGALSETYEKIREKIASCGLIHCDETGTRVEDRTWWVHNASNGSYTYLTVNQKRGQDGMDAANVLPGYQGIIVHDCWSPYWKYPGVTHAICCAHLLRELNGIIENHPDQEWAPQFKSLLLRMKKVRDRAVSKEKKTLSYYHLHKFDQDYNDILKKAYEENPLPEKTPKKRGRQKKNKVLNLICRLDKYKASVCLFAHDLTVPFDNNQAERDIRMIKLKTKVSGCFRNESGATDYLKIMSFVGTAKKHGINAFTAICEALDGTSDVIFN